MNNAKKRAAAEKFAENGRYISSRSVMLRINHDRNRDERNAFPGLCRRSFSFLIFIIITPPIFFNNKIIFQM